MKGYARKWLATALFVSGSAKGLQAQDPGLKDRVLIVVIVAGVIGGVSAVMSAKRAKTPKADASVSPRELNFGRVASPEAMNFVTVSNPTKQTLRITELRIGLGPFDAADAPALPIEIQPGSDLKIRIRFRPAARKRSSSAIEAIGLRTPSGKPWHGKAQLRGEAR